MKKHVYRLVKVKAEGDFFYQDVYRVQRLVKFLCFKWWSTSFETRFQGHAYGLWHDLESAWEDEKSFPPNKKLFKQKTEVLCLLW